MPDVNTSSAGPQPPTDHNPVGTNVNVLASVMMVLMTMIVVMRIWGRYHYRGPTSKGSSLYGQSGLWIFLSDLTIIFAWLSAITLSAAQFVYVRWGLCLHVAQLTKPQLGQAMKAFWAYQIIYKFCSGMAKIASLFLLLAIASPNMTKFNNFCKTFIVYIALYSISATLVTVFQCKLSFESNWDKSIDQSMCFYQPPFWYSHGVINLTASFLMVILPWWLFAHVTTYRRKVLVGSIMSFLAFAEGVLGIVRLYGLIKAASNGSDITFSSYIGLPISQLEVDFAVIAACVPTVLQMLEDAWVIFCMRILGRPAMLRSRGTAPGSAVSVDHHLATVSEDGLTRQPSGPYTPFDHSNITQVKANCSEEDFLPANKITKTTKFSVKHSDRGEDEPRMKW